MSFDDICRQFKVPARKGARVKYQGQAGTVTTARGLMVRVRLDGMSWSRPYAPGELSWQDSQPARLGGSEAASSGPPSGGRD